MTQRRCQSCALFYDKKLKACPDCGTQAYGFNKPLRTAQLNNHLYAQAQGAK